MGRAQETFNKKEVRNKKEKKRKEKLEKKIAKKEKERFGKLEDMMAYVDENGNISSTPPDPAKKKKFISENIEINTPRSEHVAVETVRKGTVTFFNDSKGFGFIKDSETQESVFVHVNNIIDEIKENNLVNFEVEMGQRGPTAVKVKLFVEPPKTVEQTKPEATAQSSDQAESAESPKSTEPSKSTETNKKEES